MKKKLLSVLLSVTVLASALSFTACSDKDKNGNTDEKATEGELTVYTAL